MAKQHIIRGETIEFSPLSENLDKVATVQKQTVVSGGYERPV
jgi:hypothetical protein